MAHFTIREGQTLPASAIDAGNTNGFTIDGGQGLALIGGIETDLDILFSGGNEIVVPVATTIVPMGNAYVVIDDANPATGTTLAGEETTTTIAATTELIQGGKGTAYIKRSATSPEIKVGLAEIEHGFGLPIGATVRTGTQSYVVFGNAPAADTYFIHDKDSVHSITGANESNFVGGKGIVEVEQVNVASGVTTVLDKYRIRLRNKAEFSIPNNFNGTGTATTTTITPIGTSFIVRKTT